MRLAAVTILLVSVVALRIVPEAHAVQLVANGGFELDDVHWSTTGSVGRSSSTNQFAHTGSRSLLTSNLPPYQAIPRGEYRQGAFQDVGGADAEKPLELSFWVRPRQTSLELHAYAEISFRLRTQDGLNENATARFYIVWRQGNIQANSSDMKHLLLSNIAPRSANWDGWNYVERDLAQDFGALFPQYSDSLVWGIRLSFEVMTLTTVSWAQPVLWDDVRLETGHPLIPFSVGTNLAPGKTVDEGCASQEAADVRPVRYACGRAYQAVE